MSYGLVTRALNAPIGVTQVNRFGQTRAYLPLSQFFLQQGSGSKPTKQGKVLTGKQAPAEPSEPQEKPKGKKKAKGEAMVERKDKHPVGPWNKPHKCKYCDKPATRDLIWADGRAYIPVCDDHRKRGEHRIKVKNNDEVCAAKPVVQESELNEAKKCRFCKKSATSSPGGIPCCASHEKLGKRAAQRRKAEEKGTPFALLFDEAKKYPDFGGWRLLGIDDEVETCENCGKRGLKRTMVIEPVDGDGGILHVGTTCGEILTGRKGTWLMRRAQQVQREKDQEATSSARSEIIGKLVASKFWKLHQNLWMYYLNNVVRRGLEYDERQKRSARRTMANLLRDTGLKSDAIKGYFRSKLEPKWHKHLDDWYAIALGKAEESAARCGAVAASSGRTKPTEVQKRRKRYEKEREKAEATAGLTVFKSGAAGPSAGMTGSGNIPAVAVPLGAGDGGWDAIDGPGRKRKRKRKRKKGDELSKGIDYLLRMPW